MATPAKAKKPDLAAVFDELRSICEKFSPPFTALGKAAKNKRSYVLVSRKELVIEGRKKDELWFAGVVEQKAYVSFYFMPIYCCPKMAMPYPSLMKLLKGKSCFYVKEITPELRKEIPAALKAGMATYRKNEWV